MATPVQIIRKVAEELAASGIEVHFEPGWETRGRPGTFNPRGVVCHHTATSRKAPGDYPSLGIVRDGRSDLPGPLSQFGLGRSGRVLVIAAGKANHAGPGGWRGLEGNGTVWGIEAENDGIGQPWGEAQLDAYVRLAAALARHTGFGPEMVAAHREWNPRNKIDPTGIDMKDFRAQVEAVLKNEKNQEPETEDMSMFIFDGPQGGVFRTDGITRWPIRSMETAAVLMDKAKVRHVGKLTQEAFNELRDGEGTANILQQELDRLRTQLAAVEQKVDGVASKVASLN